MARRFVIWKHRELVTPRGDRIAGGGESVPADHPALKTITDLPSVGYFEGEDEPAPKIPPRPAARFESLPTKDVDED